MDIEYGAISQLELYWILLSDRLLCLSFIIALVSILVLIASAFGISHCVSLRSTDLQFSDKAYKYFINTAIISCVLAIASCLFCTFAPTTRDMKMLINNRAELNKIIEKN